MAKIKITEDFEYDADLMQIGIDKSDGSQTTVYTIPYKLAFEMLERQVCQQFHQSGQFETRTTANVEGGGITFVVSVTDHKKEPDNG